MITNSAKAKIIELIDTELTNGELGTSTQAPALTDTGLITEVTSTISAVTGASSDRQLIVTYNINSLTGNGNTYSEYGNFFTTSETLFNRITFTGVPKNSALEFQVKTIINMI
jgi:hypothetical protein